MVNPYFEALESIRLPERKPEPLEELSPERIYSLVHQVAEAVQRLRHQDEDDEDLEEGEEDNGDEV